VSRQHAKACDVIVDEFDFSGISNSVDIEISNGLTPCTAFSDGAETFLEGKAKTNITLNALYQTTEDAEMFADLGLASDNLLAISPAAMADGGLVWTTQAHLTADTIPSPVGDAIALNCTWGGSNALGDGTILERDTNITSTVTGTAYELGAVSAAQKVVATLHVIGAAGGTLDVTIESDAAEGFDSATTQITFTQVTTTATAEIKTKDGAIADTWWRAVCTAGGGAPVYNVLVTFAIVPI